MSWRMSRLRSCNSSKRPQRAWSGGMGFFAIQPPHEYLKKSTQGSIVLSMAVMSKLGTAGVAVGLGGTGTALFGDGAWARTKNGITVRKKMASRQLRMRTSRK